MAGSRFCYRGSFQTTKEMPSEPLPDPTVFFVLTIVTLRESTSNYELAIHAGLSTYALNCAVASLERVRLICRHPSAFRKRGSLTPTANARQFLSTNLPAVLQTAKSADFLSVVRAGWAALQLDHNKGIAFLRRAASWRE